MTNDEVIALLQTIDATVWAKAWCKIAKEIADRDGFESLIDEGWMIGWFANAMCAQTDWDVRNYKLKNLESLSNE